MRHKRAVYTFILLFLSALHIVATEVDEQAAALLYAIRQNNTSNYEDDLYGAVARYCDYCLSTGNLHDYYNGWQEEIMYDIRNNHFYKAMRKTTEMATDIEKRGAMTEMWGFNYLSGVLHAVRGNGRMAETFFRKAVDLVNDEITDRDDRNCALMKIYRYWGITEMETNINNAVGYIDRAADLVNESTMAYEYSDIIAQKVMIAFYDKDWERVKANYRLYMSLDTGDDGTFDDRLKSDVEAAFWTATGDYDKAVEAAYDIIGIDRFRIIARVYEASGDYQAAYRSLEDYIHDKDSITANVMLEDLGESSKDMDIMAEQSRSERSRMINLVLIGILITAAVIIIGLTMVIRSRNRYLARLKRQNTELEIMSAKAQEAEKMKTIIYKNMSHEIRTPLNIISGFAQLMCSTDYELSKEEMGEMATAIMNSSGDIVRLINNLLELSTEVSTTYAREDEVNISGILRDLVTKVSETLPENLSIKYSTTLFDDDRVTSSSAGLSKVFSALLDNARKFSTDGEINVNCYRNDQAMIVIKITNGGQTIPQDCLEKVFEPFFKVNNDKEGLGLGLSLARNTVSQLGGVISIEATPSSTTIIVTLPGD